MNRRYVYKHPLSFLLLLIAAQLTGGEKINFMKNQGQWHCEEQYCARIGSHSLYFSDKGVTYNLIGEQSVIESEHLRDTESHLVNGHCLKMQFVNTQAGVSLGAEQVRPERWHFYIGNDRSQWTTNVVSYDELHYRNLYKLIDLVYYEKNGHLKYDFRISAGGNYHDIALSFEGQNSIRLESGKLRIETSAGIITESEPFAYQVIDNKLTTVPCRFTLKGNMVGFEFPRGYNKEYNIIIDPSILFSTYSSTNVLLSPDAATYDSQGNLYMAGGTYSTGYIASPGAFSLKGAYWNMTIEKYASAGNSLLYGAVIGGASSVASGARGSYPYSIFCDANNNLFLLGTSNTTDFPTTAGCYQANISANTADDYVICKFKSNGDSLLASTYLGGSGREGGGFQARLSSLYISSSGDIFISGSTTSANYPVSSGAFQSTFAGVSDGVISQLNNSLTTLVRSSYYGGSGDDNICDIKVAANQEIYVCGFTTSTNIPGAANGLHSSALGATDGFVAHINPGATNVLQSSYLGTSSNDRVKFLQIDSQNKVYLIGSTTHSVYPTSTGAYNAPNAVNYFVHKLNSTLDTTVFSSCIGGSVPVAGMNALIPTAFGLDQCNNIYFSGSNLNGGFPVTPNALFTSSKSIYLCGLSRSGTTLLYGSYYGGSLSGSHFHESTNNRINPNGILFHTECTTDTSYSLYKQAFHSQTSLNKAASFKFDFGFLNSDFIADTIPGTIINPVCGNNLGAASFSVTGGSGSFTYSWSPTGGNSTSASHLAPGTYTVTITDLAPACGSAVQNLTITLVNATSNPPITAIPQFTNAACGASNGAITLNVIGGSASNSYLWSPNVSSSSSASGLAPGAYTVIVSDNATNCPATPDTVVVLINSGNLSAMLTQTNTLCYNGSNGAISVTANGNQGPLSYTWQPVVSQNSNAANLPAGTYSVTVADSAGCKVNLQTTITGPPAPNVVTYTAQTSASPLVYQVSVNVSGLSAPLSYTWSTTPAAYTSTVQVNSPGVYTVSISDANNCVATGLVMIEGELTIPNVVTANNDGTNDVFKITNLPENSSLTIYNRWGNKLFETDNYQNNWSGELHPDGTYFYILSTKADKHYSGFFQLIK